MAHVIHRKASNTVKDIQNGDAGHILVSVWGWCGTCGASPISLPPPTGL